MTYSSPNVSVVMPIYNAASFLEKSIDSVINQDFTNWELLLIDDCSEDESFLIAQGYASRDSRIKVFQLDRNSGAAVARNKGIEMSSGHYIAFLDSDDYWHPEKLEKQLKYFEHYDVDVVFSEYYRFNSSGIIGKVSVPQQEINFNDLLKGNCIGNLTGIYNFKKHFETRQRKVGAEDYLFWLEIFSKQNVKGIGVPEPLAYYRVADKTKSLSSNKFRSAKWTWDIYSKRLNLSISKSIYYFTIYLFKAFRNRI